MHYIDESIDEGFDTETWARIHAMRDLMSDIIENSSSTTECRFKASAV